MIAVKGNEPGTAEWKARTRPLLSLLYAIFESLLVFREESYQCVLVSGSRRANLLHFSEGGFEGSFQKFDDIWVRPFWRQNFENVLFSKFAFLPYSFLMSCLVFLLLLFLFALVVHLFKSINFFQSLAPPIGICNLSKKYGKSPPHNTSPYNGSYQHTLSLSDTLTWSWYKESFAGKTFTSNGIWTPDLLLRYLYVRAEPFLGPMCLLIGSHWQTFGGHPFVTTAPGTKQACNSFDCSPNLIGKSIDFGQVFFAPLPWFI